MARYMDACESFADLAIHSLTQGFPSQYRKQSLYEPLEPGTHIRGRIYKLLLHYPAAPS